MSFGKRKMRSYLKHKQLFPQAPNRTCLYISGDSLTLQDVRADVDELDFVLQVSLVEFPHAGHKCNLLWRATGYPLINLVQVEIKLSRILRSKHNRYFQYQPIKSRSVTVLTNGLDSHCLKNNYPSGQSLSDLRDRLMTPYSEREVGVYKGILPWWACHGHIDHWCIMRSTARNTWCI